MSSEWKLYSLHELGRIVTGKTPKSGNPDFEGNAVPFITPPDFVGNKWIKNPIRAFSNIGAQSVKNCLIREKSVLITCIGSDMGKAALTATKCFTNQQINAIEVDETRFCPEFIYYNLSLRKEEIRAIAGGSAQPILNKTAFGKIDIFAPPLDEQKRISDFLRTFDDRITLLRETNTTLEAIAQALFKSWFVDFDPVHAKQQGRAPEGMDAQTAALFPDAFEESELGMVPKGWKVQACQEVIDVRDGTHDSPKPTTDGYPLITSRHIISGQVDFKDTYLISAQDYEAISKRSQVNRLDVLITMIGTVGATAILLNEKNDFAIKNIGLFKTSLVPNFAYYIALLLKSAKMQNHISERLAGTTQKYISLKALRAIPLVVPSEKVLNEFSKNASSFFERIKQNNLQIINLEALRDTLLPRLISGQLRLPEAQVLVEDAVDA